MLRLKPKPYGKIIKYKLIWNIQVKNKVKN